MLVNVKGKKLNKFILRNRPYVGLFTDLLPGNALIKSVTMLFHCFNAVNFNKNPGESRSFGKFLIYFCTTSALFNTRISLFIKILRL
jgi:hypothetical protein